MFKGFKGKLDNKIGIQSENELWNTSVLLTICGVIYLTFMLVDTREVIGVNTWIKPSKFAFSIASYTITFAYILPLLRISDRSKILLSRVTWVFMWIEFALISMQAVRGVQSHFNTDSAFDITIYILMGVCIALALVPAFFGTYYLFVKSKIKNAMYSLSLQWGMILLILGSAYGGRVSAGDGHSVGADDGTPGIPYLGWSLEFGDLRVAHFLAIHGIHVFLITAWLLGIFNTSYKVIILKLIIAIYYILSLGVLLINEYGESIFSVFSQK